MFRSTPNDGNSGSSTSTWKVCGRSSFAPSSVPHCRAAVVLENQTLGLADRKLRLVLLEQVIEQQQREISQREKAMSLRALEHRHSLYRDREWRILTTERCQPGRGRFRFADRATT